MTVNLQSQAEASRHVTSKTSHSVCDCDGDADGGMVLLKPRLAHRHNRRHESESCFGQQGLAAGRKTTKDFSTGTLTPRQRLTTPCQSHSTHKLCQSNGFSVKHAIGSMCQRILLSCFYEYAYYMRVFFSWVCRGTVGVVAGYVGMGRAYSREYSYSMRVFCSPPPPKRAAVFLVWG